MNEEPKYVYYRNRRIPGWWRDYLPDERNPYHEKDTLTLEKGCLAGYWHIHSSNKYPNPRGVEACNFVHEMIYIRFGGAFLTADCYSGARGEHRYHEPEHLVYKNAYIGDDGEIHIKNARQYYEDVIIFLQIVLREISKNHYQSGNSYEAREFFPTMTDAEMERQHIEWEKQRAKELREKLEQYVFGEEFFLENLAFEKVKFDAKHNLDDEWVNENFYFGKITTKIAGENCFLRIVVDMPRLRDSNSKKKNLASATRELEVPYCLYLLKDGITITIPSEKLADSLKKKINEVCNQAMEEYNREHTDMIEYENCKTIYRYYPENIFLDNKIGKLKLVYKEDAGKGSWRMYVHF